MIPLMDDHYHVEQACSLLRDNPDRKIISAIHCWLGQSPDHSRWVGLLLSILTAWILLDAFRRKSLTPKTLGPGSLRWLAIGIGVHPLFAFSFIYPAQLSTTVTCLWAATWLWLWNRAQSAQGARNKSPWIAAGLAWSCLALGIRMEAWAYAWLLWAFQWLAEREFAPEVAQARGRATVQSSTLGTRLCWLALASSPALLRPQWFGFLVQVFSDDFVKKDSITAQAQETLSTPNGQGLLQLWTEWLTTQSYAAWLYLRNALLPHLHSFYGPWVRAWQINHSWERFCWPALMLAPAGATYWVLGPLKPRQAWVRRTVLLLPVFFVPTLLLSALPRNDWYYPSRQMLGTLLATHWLVLTALSTLTFRSGRWLTKFLIGYSLSALAFCGLYQYSSLENLGKIESALHGNHSHPWADIEWGRSRLLNADPDEALRLFYKAGSSMDPELIKNNALAGQMASIAVYYMWFTYEAYGAAQRSLNVLGLLMESDFYPSVLACLQDPRVPLDRCLTPYRTKGFCEYQSNRMISRLPTLRPLRSSPCTQGF